MISAPVAKTMAALSVMIHVGFTRTQPLRLSSVPARQSDWIQNNRRPAMTADLGPLLARWRRFRRALNVDDHAAMDRVIAAVEVQCPVPRRPLEAAIVSALVELAREVD